MANQYRPSSSDLVFFRPRLCCLWIRQQDERLGVLSLLIIIKEALARVKASAAGSYFSAAFSRG